MKKITYLAFIFLLFCCSDSHDKIIITSKNNLKDCHACPGYILIQKDKNIDTLKTGSWGQPGKYSLFRYKKKDFIVLYNFYFMGGLMESGIKILSLEEDDYLEIIFDTIVDDEHMDALNIKRKELEFFSPDSLIIQSYIETYNLENEGSQENTPTIKIIKINYK